MRSANRSRDNPPPTRSGTACSGKKSNSPSSPDAINRPMTRIRQGDSRHRNRNAQYLVGPSSKDFQALTPSRDKPRPLPAVLPSRAGPDAPVRDHGDDRSTPTQSLIDQRRLDAHNSNHGA